MKNILKLASIIILLLLAHGCKEKDCVGEHCPLPDGTYCTNNMINVNNECVCPNGFTEFNENCIEKGSIPNTFVGEVNCECFGSVYISLDTSFIVNGVYYNFILADGQSFENQTNATGNQSDFSFLMLGNALNCDQDNSIQVEFNGSVQGDTLFANIYWRQQGPNWNIPLDSCEGVKIPIL